MDSELVVEVASDPIGALYAGFAPQFGSAATLAAYDVDLIKPALLYADRVDLRSANTFMEGQLNREHLRTWMPMHVVRAVLDYAADASQETLDVIGVEPGDLPDRQVAKAHQEEWRKRVEKISSNDDFDEQRFVPDFLQPLGSELDSHIGRFIPKLKLAVEGEIAELYSPEAAVAVEAGVLVAVEWTEEAFQYQMPGGEDLGDYQARASLELTEWLGDSDNPVLLDSSVTAMFESLGLFVPTQQPDVEIGLAILSGLPNVCHASVAEILDIRTELAHPLTRFRAEMVSAAREMQGLEGRDIEEFLILYKREKVAPALAEIDERRHADSYLGSLLSTVSNPKDILVSGGALALASSGAGGVATQLVAAGASALSPVAKAAFERASSQRKTKQNPFYFIHHLSGR